MRDKVTKQCPCTDHNVWRERRVEADSNRGPSAYQPYRQAKPAHNSEYPRSVLNIHVRYKRAICHDKLLLSWGTFCMYTIQPCTSLQCFGKPSVFLFYLFFIYCMLVYLDSSIIQWTWTTGFGQPSVHTDTHSTAQMIINTIKTHKRSKRMPVLILTAHNTRTFSIFWNKYIFRVLSVCCLEKVERGKKKERKKERKKDRKKSLEICSFL